MRFFNALTDVQTQSISACDQWFRTAGYRMPGDGGEALYVKVTEQPAHPGKVQSLDGAWWELKTDHVVPHMFGAYGDWTPENDRDDTQAFKDAIDYCTSFSLPGEAWPMQRQGKVLHIPEGKYGISDTLGRGQAYGMQSFIGEAQHASIIVWNKRTPGHIPFLDFDQYGENVQFRNIHTYVPPGATLPSTWIKTTKFLDHGFRVDGSYFYNAEDSIIECGGCMNPNLVNWRCEGTNNCIIKMTDIGNQPRTFQISNFTLHARDASNSAERLTVLKSFFDLTMGPYQQVNYYNKNHFLVRDSSIELDSGAIADPFRYFILRGRSDRDVCVMTTFENVMAARQTSEANPDIHFIHGVSDGSDFETAHVFKNFETNRLDDFATGDVDIDGQSLPGGSWSNKWIMDARLSSTGSVINDTAI